MKTLTLDAIRKHPKFPFLDIRDVEQYLLVQLYWLFLVKDVLGPLLNEWTFWLRHAEPGDGSSILSIRRKDRTRGVVIDQQCVACDIEEYGVAHRPLIVFMGVWEDEDDSHPMPYLKLFAAISDETMQLATRLMQKWIDPGTSEEEMNAMIDRYYDDEDILL